MVNDKIWIGESWAVPGISVDFYGIATNRAKNTVESLFTPQFSGEGPLVKCLANGEVFMFRKAFIKSLDCYTTTFVIIGNLGHAQYVLSDCKGVSSFEHTIEIFSKTTRQKTLYPETKLRLLSMWKRFPMKELDADYLTRIRRTLYDSKRTA